MNHPFQLSARLRSFKYALTGIWTMLRSQHNAWLHLPHYYVRTKVPHMTSRESHP
jgi:hypothetical protein